MRNTVRLLIGLGAMVGSFTLAGPASAYGTGLYCSTSGSCTFGYHQPTGSSTTQQYKVVWQAAKCQQVENYSPVISTSNYSAGGNTYFNIDEAKAVPVGSDVRVTIWHETSYGTQTVVNFYDAWAGSCATPKPSPTPTPRSSSPAPAPAPSKPSVSHAGTPTNTPGTTSSASVSKSSSATSVHSSVASPKASVSASASPTASPTLAAAPSASFSPGTSATSGEQATGRSSSNNEAWWVGGVLGAVLVACGAVVIAIRRR